MPRWLRILCIIAIVVAIASYPDQSWNIISEIGVALGKAAIWVGGKLADIATRVANGLG